MDFSIFLHPKNDLQVTAAKNLVMAHAMLSWVVLFEGDRWISVEVAAVAVRNDNQEIIGLASLAPCDEEGQGGPHIVGVWVVPEYRRQGIGIALVAALAEDSQKRFGSKPHIIGVSSAGICLVNSAHTRGLEVVIETLFGPDLP